MTTIFEAIGAASQVVIALGVILTWLQVIRTKAAAVDAASKAQVAAEKAVEHVAATTDAINIMAADLSKIEQSANGMKDALLEATTKAAHAEGFIAGTKAEEEKKL